MRNLAAGGEIPAVSGRETPINGGEFWEWYGGDGGGGGGGWGERVKSVFMESGNYTTSDNGSCHIQIQ